MRFLISFTAFLISLPVLSQEKFSEADLEKYVGKKVTYCNKVYGTYKSEKVILLNLGADYPNQEFVIAIFKNAWDNFDYNPEDFLKDKNICVTGELVIYRDKPEIIVNKPSQIEIKE